MLDHLVLATPDVDDTVEVITRLTGIAPVPGGSHAGLGTHNYLLGMGDSAYLEIVGPDPAQPEPPGNRPFDVDIIPEPRLVTWAIRVDDIDLAVANARDAGYNPGKPVTMERTTPDGVLLSWSLTLELTGAHTGVVPFLIDWGTTPHPAVNLPHVPLRELEAAHPDPSTVDSALRALGIEMEVRPAVRPGLRATIGETQPSVTLW